MADAVFAAETECGMFGRPQDRIDWNRKLGLGNVGGTVVQMGFEEI